MNDDSFDELVARVYELRARPPIDPKSLSLLEELRERLIRAVPDHPRPYSRKTASFRIAMSHDGDLTLRLPQGAVPVNPAYVKHVLGEERIELPPESDLQVTADVARDLILEALGELACEQMRLLALRRELMQCLRLTGQEDGRTTKCA